MAKDGRLYFHSAVMRINRRRLLWSSLSIGVASATIARPGNTQTPVQRLPEATQARPANNGLDAIFGSDRSDPSRQSQPNSLSSLSAQPTVAYDRAISSLLIRCSHLGMEQFERGQQDSRYNGSISVLPGYSREFNSYTQVATFQASLDVTTTLFPNLGDLPSRILRQVIRPTQAFFGFVLTSPSHNIIAFRGTSNPKEWVANFQARQSDYGQSGEPRGRVHTGFLRLYDQLAPQVRRTANQLDPKLPCYVTGHSLGGALATLAIADLAQTNRALSSQLQLYSYAAPRVGDAAFGSFVNTIAPNNFRIINLSDVVPMVPPSSLRAEQYSHIGQEWIFLDYAGGDIPASHTTTLYRLAIDRRVETNQIPAFPTTCR